MEHAAKQKIVKRLRIIGGQVRGLEKMIERDVYCVNAVTQSLAIKKALSSVEDALLERHLATHVVKQMRSRRPQRSIEEIMKMYRLSKRK